MLLLVLAVVADGAAAQVIIPPPCTQCIVQRVRIATLGGPQDSYSLSRTSAFVRLSDGRFVGVADGDEGLLEFDATGRFTRKVGRAGRGPGELAGAQIATVGERDTLFVWTAGRLDVYSPGLSYVRSIRAPASHLGQGVGPLVQLAGGHLVTVYASGSQRDFLHAMQISGEYGRSFGASRLEPGTPCSSCRSRFLARGWAPGEFLALSRTDYRVERWTIGGELKAMYPIAAGWFSAPPRGAPAAAPGPALTGMTLDGAGVLWVFGRAGNANWTPPPASVFGGRVAGTSVVRATGPGSMPALDVDASGHTSFIDALDPLTGSRLGSGHIAGELLLPLGGNFGYTRRQDPAGFLLFDVWELHLDRRR